ncbi:uroporphyrinogen-III synthase [Corallincola holothuriorum]|uniref:Uroporphyrinogen-III synthase n=1 Tax=Corallincola holothuriorum TaxID=2282215 RepID=A0A368N4N4_9GAMM|nr:uroporphyrinogen-III synthase [Corallincola holothuriorum]RCU45502.1 uroporphyrinogen-III synthase [Corallincola holothuriorum]
MSAPAGIRMLITRPQGRGEALQAKAAALGCQCELLPLLQILPGPDIKSAAQQLAKLCADDKVIATSQYALFALADTVTHWPSSETIAIGNATATHWQALGVNATVPQHADSEGILMLPSLQPNAIAAKQVVILKGVGGRTLLEDELAQRGAVVHSFDLYRRQPHGNTSRLADILKQKRINTLLATSAELVELIDQVIPENSAQKQALTLLVPSKRVKEIAQSLNFTNIINTQGASDDAVIRVLSEMTNTGNANG